MVSINATEPENNIRFRWKYVILPAALFLLSLILAACFYPFLPAEIAYHFQSDSPDKWLSRGAFLAWMIVPQVFFAILSIAVVRLVMLTSRYLPSPGSPLPSMLSIMGNMVALPQVVLIYAMLDFFLHDVHNINLLPLWVFALIVLVAGAVILATLFFRTIHRYRSRQAKINRE